MSRFDTRDPSLSADYCDGLSLTEPDGPICSWCGEPYTDETHDPYCSSGCGVSAEQDEQEK